MECATGTCKSCTEDAGFLRRPHKTYAERYDRVLDSSLFRAVTDCLCSTSSKFSDAMRLWLGSPASGAKRRIAESST